MTTNQESKLNMYLTVRNFIIPKEGVTKDLPNFAESYATLMSTISEIQSIGEIQKYDKTGLAMEKNRLKEQLIKMAADYSRKVTALAKFTNNITLLNEASFTETDFVRMTDVALKDYLQIIHDKAEANIGNLSKYGITPETQKVFMDTITAYNASLSTPRTGIAEKSKATKKLTVLFETADAAVENMDFSVGIIKLTQPDFFNGYKNGEIIRKTAKKGSFHIKNMQPGTYRVSVSKPGYKEKEATVSVADGERSVLKVELEKA